MELLGKANWWIPRKLDRILPDVNVDGHVETRPVAATAYEATSSNGHHVDKELVALARGR